LQSFRKVNKGVYWYKICFVVILDSVRNVRTNYSAMLSNEMIFVF